MRILAIDPAPENSGYVIIDSDDYQLFSFGKVSNEELSKIVSEGDYDVIAMEMIRNMGMPSGKSIFDTCVWIGRFLQMSNKPYKYIFRHDEKIKLCGTVKAGDKQIRNALISRFARFDMIRGKGTKKEPDYFYGFAADAWSAMAIAVTYIDMYLLNKGEKS